MAPLIVVTITHYTTSSIADALSVREKITVPRSIHNKSKTNQKLSLNLRTLINLTLTL